MKKFCYLVLITLLLASCQVKETTISPTAEPYQETVSTSTDDLATETSTDLPSETIPLPTATPSPSATASLSATLSPTAKPTETPSFTIQPVIHDQLGDTYEIVFSIPIGEGSIIQYSGGGNQEINGPTAIAVLPDGSFMILDFVGNRLLHYNISGALLEAIELEDLGIRTVIDLRVNDNSLFLLEISYRNYAVHQLSLEGELITSEKIPHDYSIGKKAAIENGLTGFTVDCDGNILLEAIGQLYFLADIQINANLGDVTQWYSCNGKHYLVVYLGYRHPNLYAGDIIYDTRLTTGFGGLGILDVFQDGSIYVKRTDVVSGPKINVDLTVHYIGADGNEQGVARVPLSELYYIITHNIAIGPEGEAYVLLPRPDSLDIVRLNFYKELAPLVPDAVIPHIIRK
ncbi:hypothetical protein ACFLZW_02100 [Chloroflexota bacterium]